MEAIDPQHDFGTKLGVKRSERVHTKTTNHHPTVKPLKLMEYLIKLFSKEGAVILDPFMGSGTTGLGCKNLNRSFIGCEIFEDYFKIAHSRVFGNDHKRQPLDNSNNSHPVILTPSRQSPCNLSLF